MAVGEPSSGKSTALKLIDRLFGLHLVSQSSAEFVVSEFNKNNNSDMLG
jgi:ABC-type proline/glycine betaine transport system ATPase subunit